MKGMWESVKIVMVIVIISAGAAALLAVVKSATADAIIASEKAEEKKGVALVLPKGAETDLDKAVPMKLIGDNNEEKDIVVYPGFANGGLTGIAVRTSSEKGYSGHIGLLVGFTGLDSPDNLKVTRIYVLQHSETPGLGANSTSCQDEADAGACPEGTFWTHYIDRPVDLNVLKVTKDGGQIEAITSATISSRAITGAVREAGMFVKEKLPEIKASFAAGKEVAK